MAELPDRDSYINKVLRGYETYYDIERKEPSEDSALCATAFFHEKSVGYALIKSAEMWAANRNEYIYIFSLPSLSAEIAAKCIKEAYDDGYPRIKPDQNHMSSYIEAVFVCGECDDQAVNTVKKYRKRESFQFALHGWMEVHAVIVDLKRGRVTANISNIETVKYLKNVLDGRKPGTAIGRCLNTFLQILKN